MPPLRMNDLVWGATHEELPDINPSDSTAFLQKLGTSPLWSVLGWTDLFLPPFRAASESTAIASESSASVGIPSHQALRVVLEDLDWVEDLEALARERWNLTDDDRQSGAHPDWDSTSLAMVRNSDLIRQFYTLGPDDIVLEESEADTDMRCRTETFLLNPLYKLVAPPPLPTFSFTSKAQASTKITGGGIVRPDVDFIYAQIEPQRTKNLLRAGNKTVLVQYKHATEIQRMIGIPKAAGWTSLAARGICTQAYAASFKVTHNLPPFNIVMMGNPSLWRMGYRLPGELVVSKWYSTNPTQARDVIPELDIHQGHLLRQKLALTILDTDFLSNRHSRRSRPSQIAVILERVGTYKASTFDVFTRLGELLFRSSTGDLDLDGALVHVACITASDNFRKTLPAMGAFKTIRSGKVWTNGEWFLKIPSGVDEIIATKKVSTATSAVDFGAELRITTGEHKGVILLATRSAGERAGTVHDLLEDLDIDTKTQLVALLKSIHEAGWHHHDLHPANVVIMDGIASVIDYGAAQRASECDEPCPDIDAVLQMALSPSSPTDTAVDSLAEAGKKKN